MMSYHTSTTLSYQPLSSLSFDLPSLLQLLHILQPLPSGMKFHLEKAEPEVLETVEAVVVAEEGGEEE